VKVSSKCCKVHLSPVLHQVLFIDLLQGKTNSRAFVLMFSSQAHDARCTNEFYSERVKEELSAQAPSDEEKMAIMEMLERDHIAREEDAAQWDGSELISQLAISDELDESMLTAQQRAEFHRALRQGRLGALVTPWRPWWAAAADVPVQSTTGRADVDHSDGDDSNALRLVRGRECVS